MIDLKALAGKRYRVVVEESYEAGADDDGKLWFYQIPARYGHVFVQSADSLGVYVKGRLKVNMVAAMPGLTKHQRGDLEASFIFAPELLDAVADAVGAKKRRQLSDEYKAEISARGTKALNEFHKRRKQAPEPGSHA